jgi:DNA-binding beta-propeller fold protein YncE
MNARNPNGRLVFIILSSFSVHHFFRLSSVDKDVLTQSLLENHMFKFPKSALVLAAAVTAFGVGGCTESSGARPEAAATATPTAQHGPYVLAKEMHVGGEGRWDYIVADPDTKLLYVSRQTHTQILRAGSGEVVADLKDTPGVHGVALVPELSRGFTSNGKGNSVTIFNLKTNAVLGTSKTGENPDAILYDPASKKLFTFNGKSQDATVLDPAAEPGAAAVATIPLGDKPEFAQSDGKGHVYVNLEGKSSVVEIDTNAMKVANTWKIEGGDGPSGMAIDVAHHRLFCGCDNEIMAVVDTQTGKTLATVPIGKGVDACGFDPGTGEAFASCGDGTLTVIRETSPGKFEVVQTVKTRPSARTMALDLTTHTIYLPASELEELKPGEKRAASKPGSFMIVVVAPAPTAAK